jgi:VWFA-related protein
LSGQQTVFRGGVELVEVTVSVTDANGQAVKDLTIDDFEVREGGKPQAIALFDRIEIPLPPSVPEDAPPMPAVAADVATNNFPENGRAFAIVVDDQRLDSTRTPAVRRLARLFVERHVGPQDLLLVLGSSGRTTPTQEFTTDKARALQAIDSMVGIQAPSYEELAGLPGADLLKATIPGEGEFNLSNLFSTLKALAAHLSDVHRRRMTMVFLSEGFSEPGPGMGSRDVFNEFRRTVEILQQSNTTVYVLNPLSNGDLPSTGSRALAEATGGFAAMNTFQWASQDFDRIIQESSHYYLLGYYPTERRSEGQFREIDVRVRRPGLKVSNRPGYVYRTPKPPAAPARPAPRRATPVSLAALLDNPLPTSGLPMFVQAIPLRQSDTRARVQLIVEVAGKDLSFEAEGGRFVERIEFATVAFDSRGRRGVERTTASNLRLTAAERDRAVRTGVRWVSIMDLPHGRHDVRVAGHAITSDRRGSVFIDVDVPRFDREMITSGLAVTSLTAATMFTTGSPILLPPLPSAPTAQRSFPLGDVLAVSAEIYRPSERTMLFLRKPGEVPSEFVVRVSEAASPQRVVLDQPLPVLNDRHTTPYLSFAINTKNLGVGQFVLRLVRRSGDQPADEVPGAVPFEVVAR